jgi:hypothetical protein
VKRQRRQGSSLPLPSADRCPSLPAGRQGFKGSRMKNANIKMQNVKLRRFLLMKRFFSLILIFDFLFFI